MSLFADIVKNALGASAAPEQTEAQTSNLLGGALGMLESLGGVDGLMKKFQQSGLGDVVSSWVETGENKSISPEQLASVLGKDQIAALAQQAGVPESKGAGLLAEFLPAVVDKLTPDGMVPDSSKLATIGKVLLGGVGVAVAAKAAASYFGKKDEMAEVPAAGSGQASVAPSAAATEAASVSNAAAAARTYTVVSGDTLSKIAKHLYGDANQWQRIYEANRDVLNNPDRIFPGQNLRIP